MYVFFFWIHLIEFVTWDKNRFCFSELATIIMIANKIKRTKKKFCSQYSQILWWKTHTQFCFFVRSWKRNMYEMSLMCSVVCKHLKSTVPPSEWIISDQSMELCLWSSARVLPFLSLHQSCFFFFIAFKLEVLISCTICSHFWCHKIW